MILQRLWPLLPTGLRARLVRRIVVTGAESTGTTTLALRLAEALNCPYVPEYGREYTEKRAPVTEAPWRPDELLDIAETQIELENEAALRSVNRWLVADTDALTTTLWHERYFGRPSPELNALAENQSRPYAYILTGDDIPFEGDAIREGGRERQDLQEKLRATIKASGIPFIEVRGSVETRLEDSLAFLQNLSK